tara:strand:- start:1260 stop:1412 length:153 start_codon:yes stop_codon:yes gene_type:complete
MTTKIIYFFIGIILCFVTYIGIKAGIEGFKVKKKLKNYKKITKKKINIKI